VKRLYRSRENRMICGVAGGVASFLEVDPTVARVIWLFSLLLGVIPSALVYAACCFLIPDEPLLD